LNSASSEEFQVVTELFEKYKDVLVLEKNTQKWYKREKSIWKQLSNEQDLLPLIRAFCTSHPKWSKTKLTTKYTFFQNVIKHLSFPFQKKLDRVENMYFDNGILDFHQNEGGEPFRSKA
jgi:hypothetical protein